MTRSRTLLLSLLASTALAVPTYAEETTVLDEIVIYYGALTAAPQDKTAASVTVLSRKDLEQTGETRLTEILARQPGLGVVARGPIGSQSGLTIRGLSQNYIKVLVDGIDVADPSTPQVAYDFGRLNAGDFGRVELIRGSNSTVLGSSAIGGAVILDTRRPEADGISQSVAIEAGSYDSLSAVYNFGAKKGADEFALTLSKIRTDGFSIADENNGNPEADGYDAIRLSMRGQKEFGAVTLGFAAFAQNDESDIDSSFGMPVDAFDTTTHRERGARVFARFATGVIEHDLSAQYFSGYRYYTSDYGAYDYRGTRRKLAWTATAPVGPGKLSFGLDRTLEDYEGTYVSGTVKTTLNGASAEYAFAPVAGVDLVASLRHDDNSTFGGQTTGRIGATWAVADDLLLRAAFATGFRAPSGYELYDPWSGNTALVPETSRSFDLGVEKSWGETKLTATLFRIETEDLIDYVNSAYVQVPGQTTRQGIELGLDGSLGARLSYAVNYTYLDWSNPVISSSSSWNTSFGRHTLNATLSGQITDQLTGALSLRHVADRQALPDYTVLNGQIGYELAAGKSAYLRVENLLDTEYQLWPGYGTSDRAVYVGLRASF